MPGLGQSGAGRALGSGSGPSSLTAVSLWARPTLSASRLPDLQDEKYPPHQGAVSAQGLTPGQG